MYLLDICCPFIHFWVLIRNAWLWESNVSVDQYSFFLKKNNVKEKNCCRHLSNYFWHQSISEYKWKMNRMWAIPLWSQLCFIHILEGVETCGSIVWDLSLFLNSAVYGQDSWVLTHMRVAVCHGNDRCLTRLELTALQLAPCSVAQSVLPGP